MAKVLVAKLSEPKNYFLDPSVAFGSAKTTGGNVASDSALYSFHTYKLTCMPLKKSNPNRSSGASMKQHYQL